MFNNMQINVDDIPAIESVNLKLLNPKLKTRSFINRCLFSLFLLAGNIVLYIFIPFEVYIFLGILLILLKVIIVIWPYISYPKKKYALREHDIIYQNGVFWKSYKVIPFNRLQHIELTRSPIDRMLNLATLVFYTAGGNYGDLSIAGFENAEADKIREHILDILNKDSNEQSE